MILNAKSTPFPGTMLNKMKSLSNIHCINSNIMYGERGNVEKLKKSTNFFPGLSEND